MCVCVCAIEMKCTHILIPCFTSFSFFFIFGFEWLVSVLPFIVGWQEFNKVVTAAAAAVGICAYMTKKLLQFYNEKKKSFRVFGFYCYFVP